MAVSSRTDQYGARAMQRLPGLLLLACWLPASLAGAAEKIWLSDLDLSHYAQEWQTPGADLSVSGRPLTIAGSSYAKGVGTHAHSRFLLDLEGQVLRFEAKVGVDDHVVPPGEKATWGGAVVFRVVGDGRDLWEAKSRWGQKPIQITVDLAGVKHLELVVEDDQDGNWRDHADWADAFFTVDGGTLIPTAQLRTVSVTVTPGTRFQTFYGFGEGSMGQDYGRVFGQYDHTTREAYLDAIYTSKTDGLALEISRANVTVGDAPEHQHMTRRPWSKLNPNGWEVVDGVFDTTNHEAEVWMYRGAQNRGATMLYFWNGPPYWMTVSGCSSGSVDGTSNNLPAGQEPRFARHIVDVLDLLRETYGLRADLVCPINEPECDWWKAGDGGGQEGCHTSAEQAVVIFRELRRELDRRGLKTTGIVGPEAAYGNGSGYGKDILKHPEARAALVAVSVHQYITSPWGYWGWRDVARDAGLPLWQSEWGNWRLPGDADPVRRQHHAMSYGRQIHDALTRYNAAAWCMWEPGSLFDFSEGGFFPRPAFYVTGHYSRDIRRGMVRVEARDDTLRSVCFLTPEAKQFVLVTLNDTITDRTMSYDLSGFAEPTIVSCVRSGPEEKRAPVPCRVEDGRTLCTLPAFSVLTLTGTYADLTPTSP